MKNYKKFLFLALLLAFIGSTKVFALSCTVSQSLNGSDQCWTKVTLSSVESTLVSAGTVLVYEIDNSTPAQGGYQVRIARASAENNFVAGVAQGPIVSGSSAMILAHGPGFIFTSGQVVSGDSLFAKASGEAGNIATTSVNSTTIAVALQSVSTQKSKTQAYIKVI